MFNFFKKKPIEFTITPVRELEEAPQVFNEITKELATALAEKVDSLPLTIEFAGKSFSIAHQVHTDGTYWWGYEAADGSFIGYTGGTYEEALDKLINYINVMGLNRKKEKKGVNK